MQPGSDSGSNHATGKIRLPHLPHNNPKNFSLVVATGFRKTLNFLGSPPVHTRQ